MPNQFEFILEDGPAKPKGAVRSLIRSRSMLGKNKIDGSRRSIRQKKRVAATSNQVTSRVMIPRPPPVDLELVRLASDTGPRAQELLYKLMTSNAAHFSISPLELCVDFDFVQNAEFGRLFYDSTFLSAALFTSSAINDLATSSRRQPSGETLFYLRRTLSTLHGKLDRKDAHRANSTILVIITLALLSIVFGDLEAASAHIAGLHRVVELCGGLKFLRQKAKLHYKIERLDLSWTLSSGGRPYFSPDLIAWDRTFKSRPLLSTSSMKFQTGDGLGDGRLAIVYEDLQYLTVTINANVHEHTRWKGDCFQKILSSIQTRLLRLMKELKEPIQEFVCLSMLACLTTSFKIPGRIITYSYLADRFRESCLAIIAKPLVREMEALELWGLMIGAISVFDIEEEIWLVRRGGTVVRGKDMEWHDVQQRLQSVMWIDCIHDKAGKKVFERISRTATQQPETTIV